MIGDGSQFNGLALVSTCGLAHAGVAAHTGGLAAMIDQVIFTANYEEIAEGSALNVTAKFRDQSARADGTPTTVEWSLRDPDACRLIQNLTSVTPGTSVTLATTATQNTCQTLGCDERREITVILDRGLSTQFTATHLYSIRNIGAIRQ